MSWLVDKANDCRLTDAEFLELHQLNYTPEPKKPDSPRCKNCGLFIWCGENRGLFCRCEEIKSFVKKGLIADFVLSLKGLK